MFRKSRKKSKDAASTQTNPAAVGLGKKYPPSVISADMNVLGNIVSDGFVDINGKVDGNVKCHSAIIREFGSVKGDVVADNIQIHGYVEGLVKAKSVTLHQTAHVSGIIMHESLSIEDGAFVDGKFKRTDRVFMNEDEHVDAEEEEASQDNGPAESVMDNLRLISADS